MAICMADCLFDDSCVDAGVNILWKDVTYLRLQSSVARLQRACGFRTAGCSFCAPMLRASFRSFSAFRLRFSCCSHSDLGPDSHRWEHNTTVQPALVD